MSIDYLTLAAKYRALSEAIGAIPDRPVTDPRDELIRCTLIGSMLLHRDAANHCDRIVALEQQVADLRADLAIARGEVPTPAAVLGASR